MSVGGRKPPELFWLSKKRGMVMIFFGGVVLWFLLGVLREIGVFVWCFCGAFVVLCMASVVVEWTYFWW
jgi:hypothetical protein